MLKINYKKIAGALIAFSFVIILLSPVALLHANPPVDGSLSNTTIENPLGNNKTVESLLGSLLKLVFMVGAIVVVFFIIYSGYKFVAARGNSDKINEAKETFYATVIGAAILLGADIIATVVVNTVNAVK
jgi:hypothetical protein